MYERIVDEDNHSCRIIYIHKNASIDYFLANEKCVGNAKIRYFYSFRSEYLSTSMYSYEMIVNRDYIQSPSTRKERKFVSNSK